MKADINYGASVNKEFVQQWWKTKGNSDIKSAIGIMANATNVPCINIAFWIAEIEGWPEEFKQSIDTLIMFYGYTEVINKPKGCKW